jgi:hypothetical protein
VNQHLSREVNDLIGGRGGELIGDKVKDKVNGKAFHRATFLVFLLSTLYYGVFFFAFIFIVNNVRSEIISSGKIDLSSKSLIYLSVVALWLSSLGVMARQSLITQSQKIILNISPLIDRPIRVEWTFDMPGKYSFQA